MSSATAVTGRLAATAAAKVNLTLRVLGRRADGYHDIESLVVFARVGDALTLDPGTDLRLDVDGPTAAAAGNTSDNLVIKAVTALMAQTPDLVAGHFALTKALPVAAGLGGGSADAAAALRLLARANGLPADDARLFAAARATGADVPVCLDPKPRMMRGIGDILSAPLDLPPLPAVLVNPGVPVPTRDVFAALAIPPGETRGRASRDFDDFSGSATDLLARLASSTNDLEAPALAIAPVIAHVLDDLRQCGGCGLARMSGSGATCFGVFDTDDAAAAAAARLATDQPKWWVRATSFGEG